MILRTRHLLLCPAFLLASCAAMQEDYRARTCHREIGYERGNNDAMEGRAMDSSFATACDPDSQKLVMQGYRDGYEAARNQATLEANAGGIRVKVPGVDIRMGQPSSWVCRLQPFTQKFSGYGTSRAQAASDARRLCEQEHHAIHCERPDCREER
jgi:hypothetical protein